MIVGVAAKVVPTLNGVDVRGLASLWVPFVLINAGCGLRVATQTLTDFTPASFPFAGVSGLLEVAGLAVWGIPLWSIMAGRVPRPGAARGTTLETGRLLPGSPIGPTSLVGDILEQHPELLQVFLSFGFRPLANPLLRRSLAGRITIERACRLTGQDTEKLIEALNTKRAQRSAGRHSLTVLPVNGAAR